MLLNEECYYGEGSNKRRVTLEQASTSKRRRELSPEPVRNLDCKSNIHVYPKDRLHEARFQHLPGNEKCLWSKPVSTGPILACHFVNYIIALKCVSASAGLRSAEDGRR